MTTTIGSRDGITAVHNAAELGGVNGLTVSSIAAMLSFTERATEDHLLAAADRGIVFRIGQRWIAQPICPTCGWGAGDRYHLVNHPGGVCETHPVDYCVGYPLRHHA